MSINTTTPSLDAVSEDVTRLLNLANASPEYSAWSGRKFSYLDTAGIRTTYSYNQMLDLFYTCSSNALDLIKSMESLLSFEIPEGYIEKYKKQVIIWKNLDTIKDKLKTNYAKEDAKFFEREDINCLVKLAVQILRFFGNLWGANREALPTVIRGMSDAWYYKRMISSLDLQSLKIIHSAYKTQSDQIESELAWDRQIHHWLKRDRESDLVVGADKVIYDHPLTGDALKNWYKKRVQEWKEIAGRMAGWHISHSISEELLDSEEITETQIAELEGELNVLLQELTAQSPPILSSEFICSALDICKSDVENLLEKFKSRTASRKQWDQGTNNKDVETFLKIPEKAQEKIESDKVAIIEKTSNAARVILDFENLLKEMQHIFEEEAETKEDVGNSYQEPKFTVGLSSTPALDTIASSLQKHFKNEDVFGVFDLHAGTSKEEWAKLAIEAPKAYRNIILQVHPDKNPNCQKRAQEITQHILNVYSEVDKRIKQKV
jgi:hypothetical protein